MQRTNEILSITKKSAKQHCRICLIKLNDVGIERDITKCHSPAEDGGDTKSISINVSTDENLLQLIEYYIGNNTIKSLEYPQNVCLSCFNKLQGFDKFRKRALESVALLQSLFAEDITKVELDDDVEDENEIGNGNIYSMMFKDALMETESILLKDHSDISALVSVEIQVPDPFSANNISKLAVKKIGKSRKKTSARKTDKQDEDHDTDNYKDIVRKTWEKPVTQKNYKDDEDVNYSDNGSESEYANSCMLSSTDDDDTPLSKIQKSSSSSEPLEHHGYRGRTKTKIKQPKKDKLRAKPRKKVAKKSHRCDQCNHSFAHKLTRDAHIRKVHEDKKRPYQCDRCDKTYTSFYALSTHISVIHEAEVRSYTCEYPDCHRNYKSLNALQKHKRDKHLGLFKRKTYICELCGATYSNLKHHLRCKHPIEAGETSKEKHTCNICNKQFHSHYTLKYHALQLHSNDMKFECNTCGKRLAKKFMLVQHMRIHTLDCFPCNQCDKQFKLKNKLDSHVRAVHLKLKPYSCQYCPEIFAKRSTLQHHEYIHTGEKPYVCDICGQAYRQHNTLKGHRKSHDTMLRGTLLAKSINRTLETFLEDQQLQLK